MGQTTNENSKWSDIRDWYKRQQKRYNKAVKEGKVPKRAVDTAAPTVETPQVQDDDGDVTCTPGTSLSSSLSTSLRSKQDPAKDKVDMDFVDPGAVPKNIYHRGFAENWKEVILPMSLRKDATSLGGYTKIPPPRTVPLDDKNNAPQLQPPPPLPPKQQSKPQRTAKSKAI